MGQPLIHLDRRATLREPLALAAQLDCVGGVKICTLQDISKTGARLDLPNPPWPGECAALKAGDIDVFGIIVWRSHAACGLRFDHEIREGRLIEMHQNVAVIA
ncbi:MAG: PilZ domain-containing protein, partial [Marinomonas sp.]